MKRIILMLLSMTLCINMSILCYAATYSISTGGSSSTVPVTDPDDDLQTSIIEDVPEPDSWYRTKGGLWYYFLDDGKTTKKGWFVDSRDDQTYYLDPTTGIMAVGWTTIDGKQYYFNESHDNEINWYPTGGGFFESYNKKVKAYGSMFKNEYTPDGKFVSADGSLILSSGSINNVTQAIGSLKEIDIQKFYAEIGSLYNTPPDDYSGFWFDGSNWYVIYQGNGWHGLSLGIDDCVYYSDVNGRLKRNQKVTFNYKNKTYSAYAGDDYKLVGLKFDSEYNIIQTTN